MSNEVINGVPAPDVKAVIIPVETPSDTPPPIVNVPVAPVSTELQNDIPAPDVNAGATVVPVETTPNDIPAPDVNAGGTPQPITSPTAQTNTLSTVPDIKVGDAPIGKVYGGEEGDPNSYDDYGNAIISNRIAQVNPNPTESQVVMANLVLRNADRQQVINYMQSYLDQQYPGVKVPENPTSDTFLAYGEAKGSNLAPLMNYFGINSQDQQVIMNGVSAALLSPTALSQVTAQRYVQDYAKTYGVDSTDVKALILSGIDTRTLVNAGYASTTISQAIEEIKNPPPTETSQVNAPEPTNPFLTSEPVSETVPQGSIDPITGIWYPAPGEEEPPPPPLQPPSGSIDPGTGIFYEPPPPEPEPVPITPTPPPSGSIDPGTGIWYPAPPVEPEPSPVVPSPTPNPQPPVQGSIDPGTGIFYPAPDTTPEPPTTLGEVYPNEPFVPPTQQPVSGSIDPITGIFYPVVLTQEILNSSRSGISQEILKAAVTNLNGMKDQWNAFDAKWASFLKNGKFVGGDAKFAEYTKEFNELKSLQTQYKQAYIQAAASFVNVHNQLISVDDWNRLDKKYQDIALSGGLDLMIKTIDRDNKALIAKQQQYKNIAQKLIDDIASIYNINIADKLNYSTDEMVALINKGVSPQTFVTQGQDINKVQQAIDSINQKVADYQEAQSKLAPYGQKPVEDKTTDNLDKLHWREILQPYFPDLNLKDITLHTKGLPENVEGSEYDYFARGIPIFSGLWGKITQNESDIALGLDAETNYDDATKLSIIAHELEHVRQTKSGETPFFKDDDNRKLIESQSRSKEISIMNDLKDKGIVPEFTYEEFVAPDNINGGVEFYFNNESGLNNINLRNAGINVESKTQINFNDIAKFQRDNPDDKTTLATLYGQDVADKVSQYNQSIDDKVGTVDAILASRIHYNFGDDAPKPEDLTSVSNAMSKVGVLPTSDLLINMLKTGAQKNEELTKIWNSLTPEQKSQVADLVVNDVNRGDSFASANSEINNLISKGGLTAEVFTSTVTPITNVIAKQVTLDDARRIMSQRYSNELVAVKDYINDDGTVDINRFNDAMDMNPEAKDKILEATGYKDTDALRQNLEYYNNGIKVSNGEWATAGVVGALDVLSIGGAGALARLGTGGKIVAGAIPVGAGIYFTPSSIKTVMSDAPIAEKILAGSTPILMVAGGVVGIKGISGETLSPYGKVEMPIKSGELGKEQSSVVWRGVKIGDQPLIGVSQGKIVVGSKGVTLPPVENWKLAGQEGVTFMPETALETKILVNKGALEKAGVVEPEKFVSDIQNTVGQVKQFYGKKSPFMDAQMLAEPIDTFSSKGIEAILKQAVADRNIVDRVFGSSTMRPQFKPEILKEWQEVYGRTPGDVDVFLKNVDAQGAADFAKRLVDRINKESSDSAWISDERPTLVMAKSKTSGAERHGIDIHFEGEPVEGVQSATAEYAYGMRIKQPTVKVKVEGIGDINIARLSETGMGKMGSVLNWRIDPETGNVILRTAEHRLKDYIDLYEIIKNYNGEKAANKWVSDIGLDLETFKNLANKEPKLNSWEFKPSEYQSVSSSGYSPVISIISPSLISASTSPTIGVTSDGSIISTPIKNSTISSDLVSDYGSVIKSPTISETPSESIYEVPSEKPSGNAGGEKSPSPSPSNPSPSSNVNPPSDVSPTPPSENPPPSDVVSPPSVTPPSVSPPPRVTPPPSVVSPPPPSVSPPSVVPPPSVSPPPSVVNPPPPIVYPGENPPPDIYNPPDSPNHPTIPLKHDTEMQQKVVDNPPPGTVVWVQGRPTYIDGTTAAMYKILVPPYSTDDMFSSRQIPNGYEDEGFEGKGSALKSIKVIGGLPPENVENVDLGFVKINIGVENNQPVIEFVHDESANVGERSKTIGMGKGQIPISAWKEAKAQGISYDEFIATYNGDLVGGENVDEPQVTESVPTQTVVAQPVVQEPTDELHYKQLFDNLASEMEANGFHTVYVPYEALKDYAAMNIETAKLIHYDMPENEIQLNEKWNTTYQDRYKNLRRELDGLGLIKQSENYWDAHVQPSNKMLPSPILKSRIPKRPKNLKNWWESPEYNPEPPDVYPTRTYMGRSVLPPNVGGSV